MAGQKSNVIEIEEPLVITAPRPTAAQPQKEETAAPVPLSKLAHPTGARRQAEWARRMQHRLGNDAVLDMVEAQASEQPVPTSADASTAEAQISPAPEPPQSAPPKAPALPPAPAPPLPAPQPAAPTAAATSAQAHRRAEERAAQMAQPAAPKAEDEPSTPKAKPGGPQAETLKAPKPAPEETKTSKPAGARGAAEDPATGEGTDVVMWRASAVRAAKNIPAPKISGAGGVGAIQKTGGAASDASKAKAQQVPKDGEKAVSPAPKPGDLPPNPVAKPDPVPEATQIVNDASDKLPPDQTIPGLEASPVTKEMPSLIPPMPPPTVAKGDADKADAAKAPPDAKDTKNPAQAKADQVKQAADKPPEKLDRKSDAEPVTLKDVAQEKKPEPPFPPMFKMAIAPVLAELLANTREEAKDILTKVRKSMYSGELANQFPDMGDEDLLPDLTITLEGQLRDIGKQAGMTEQEINAEVEKRRAQTKTQTDQAKTDIQTTGDTQTKEVKDTSTRLLEAIAGARGALDEATEQKLEAAKGEGDPAVIRSKRERLTKNVSAKVADQVVAYDEAGKRRKARIANVIGLQQKAYRRRAQDDEKQLTDKATADKTDVKKAQLTAAESFNWSDRKGRELDKLSLTFNDQITQWVTDQQDGVRKAGETAREKVRTWADQKLGEQRSWLRKLIDRYTDWAQAAKAESAAWETQRNKETRNQLASDVLTLNLTIAKAGEDVDVSKEETLAGLDEAQKAIFKAYYGKDSAVKGNRIAALAAGLRIRVGQQRAPQLVKQLNTLLDATDAKDWPKLNAIGKTENTSFSAATLADDVYKALHGGLFGWNDEQAVFKALNALTHVQSLAVKACYKSSHGMDLAADLKDQLHGSEEDRALAQLEGDQAVADAATIYYALHGGVFGVNDTGTVMKTLRNKPPAVQARIKKAYQEKYGKDLDADLEDQLKPIITNDTHDVKQAQALRDSDVARADAIAVDGAMRGGITGWGADMDVIEGVHKQIREDVTAELTAKAQTEGRDVTTAEIEAEIARRNRQMESAYNKEYAADWKDKGAPGESALRVAYKDEFGTDPKNNAKITLVNALVDNDLTKADAAKLAIEHQSIIYASDDIQNEVLQHQYQRALEEVKRDKGPALRREMEKRRQADAAAGKPWDKYKLRDEEKKMQAELENEAKSQGKQYMNNLATTYDKEVGKYGEGSFGYQMEFNMSGYDLEKARLLRKQGGYLSPAQQVYFSTEGLGTNGDQFKEGVRGKSKEELEQLEEELLDMKVDAATKAQWAGKSPEEIKRLKRKWLDEHPDYTLKALAEDETSGRLAKELSWSLQGEPKNADEEIALMRDKLKYEQDHPGLFASHELKVLEQRMALMEEQYKGLTEDKNLTPEERVKRLEMFGQMSESVQSAVDKHKDQVEAVTDTVVKVYATVVAVAALVLVAIVSGGTAVPAELAAIAEFLGTAAGAATLAMGTAVAGVGIRYAIMGNAYEGESALKELGIGAVEALAAAATAGIGGKLLTSQFEQMIPKLIKAGWSKAEIAALQAMLAESSVMQKPLLGQLAQRGIVSKLVVESAVSGTQNVLGAVPGTVAQVLLDNTPGDKGAQLKQALKGSALQSFGMGVGMHLGGQALTAGVKGVKAKPPAAKPGAADTPVTAGDKPAVKGDPPVTHNQTETLPSAKADAQAKADLPNTDPTVRAKQEGIDPAAADPTVRGHADDSPTQATKPKLDLTPSEVETRMAQGGDPIEKLQGAVPKDLEKIGGQVRRNPDLTDGSVEVHYKYNEKGVITEIWFETGAGVTAKNIQEHIATARALRQYSGLAGRARSLVRRIATLVSIKGLPEPGTKLFEARLEVDKLQRLIDDRMSLMGSEILTPQEELKVAAEIASLKAQLDTHQRVVIAEEGGLGAGFVAVKHDEHFRENAEDLLRRSEAAKEAIKAKSGKKRYGWDQFFKDYAFEKTADGWRIRRIGDSAELPRLELVFDPPTSTSLADATLQVKQDLDRSFPARKTRIANANKAPLTDFPEFEAELKNKGWKPDSEDAGAARKWGDLVKKLADEQQLTPAQRKKLAQELLGELSTGFGETENDNYRKAVRQKIAEFVGGVQDSAKRRQLMDAFLKNELWVDDMKSKGELFSAIMKENARRFPAQGIRPLSETEAPSLAIDTKVSGKDRIADGAVEVKGQKDAGAPPDGKFLVEDKAGPTAFKPDQADDYSANLKKGGGKIKAGGREYDGVIYRFDTLKAAEDAMAKIKLQGEAGAVHKNIYVCYVDAQGQLQWIDRSP